MLQYVDHVLVPYVARVRQATGRADQKVILLLDVYKTERQKGAIVAQLKPEKNILGSKVPKVID